jgi:hypothetical protein
MPRAQVLIPLVLLVGGCSSVVVDHAALDGGTPIVSCDRLLPGPPGTPVSVPGAWPWPKDQIWADAQPLVDRQGNVLQRIVKQELTTLNVWSSGGVLLASTTVSSEQSPVLPLASGWVAVDQHDGPPPLPTFDLLLLGPDAGTRATPSTPGNAIITQDPRGGVVALSLPGGELTAYDDLLQPRWSANVPLVRVALIQEHTTVGVDVSGHVLILFWTTDHPGPLSGVWVSADGEVGPSFVAGQADPNQFLSLEPDANGGLFLRTMQCSGHCVNGWSGRFAALGTVQEQPPTWRVDLVGLDTRLIHGGTGYAVIGGEPTCLSGCPVPPFSLCQIGVFAADGTNCGVIDFGNALRGAPPPPFGQSALVANAGSGPPECVAFLDVGLDGTVTAIVSAQLVHVPCDPETGLCADVVDWFPAYFR